MQYSRVVDLRDFTSVWRSGDPGTELLAVLVGGLGRLTAGRKVLPARRRADKARQCVLGGTFPTQGTNVKKWDEEPMCEHLGT